MPWLYLISKKEVNRKIVPVTYVEFEAVAKDSQGEYKATVCLPEDMVTDSQADIDSVIAQMVWHKCHPVDSKKG